MDVMSHIVSPMYRNDLGYGTFSCGVTSDDMNVSISSHAKDIVLISETKNIFEVYLTSFLICPGSGGCLFNSKVINEVIHFQ